MSRRAFAGFNGRVSVTDEAETNGDRPASFQRQLCLMVRRALGGKPERCAVSNVTGGGEGGRVTVIAADQHSVFPL